MRNAFRMMGIVSAFVVSGIFAIGSALAQTATAPTQLPYLNPALPLDQRVDDLVGRMTLDEEGVAGGTSSGGGSAIEGACL